MSDVSLINLDTHLPDRAEFSVMVSRAITVRCVCAGAVLAGGLLKLRPCEAQF